MIIPERLLTGVSCSPGNESAEVEMLEIGADMCDVPTAKDVRALAGDRGITLIASPVITHRRTDARYKRMTSPPPEHAAVGHFERSRWTDEAWEETDKLARAVDAQAAVLQTPPSFKPTADHATRLENFVAHAMRPGLALAWEWAPGSWPLAKALELCERVGALPVLDPTEHTIPESEFAYVRFRGGKSGRKVLDDDDLKTAALALRDRPGWAIFSNAKAEQDARRFAEMI
ncbi:MAG TPA: DUF72 domain-containing protein [Actinomycetota bacterium]